MAWVQCIVLVVMEFTTLEGKARVKGKSKTRALRREGQVPSVLYGNNVEPLSFHIDVRSLNQLIRAQETPLVQIELDGQIWKCILKTVDYHPVTDIPIHADFQVLQDGEKISLTVPFKFKGTPVGQRQGGNTQYVLSDVDVVCLPKDIPPYVEIDIAELGIGEGIHIRDLDFEGVQFSAPESQTIVMIHAPRISGTATDEEGKEGTEGEEVEAAEEE